jgi:hypothetical protein
MIHPSSQVYQIILKGQPRFDFVSSSANCRQVVVQSLFHNSQAAAV